MQTSTYDHTVNFFVGACLSTVGERKSWIAVLEAEERERLESLRASSTPFRTGDKPTPLQVNALLIAALQGQLTLLRVSRVFPQLSASKCMDISRALRHEPTVALACQLHHCWRVLGVGDSTVTRLLHQAVMTVGTRTWNAREALYSDPARQPPEESGSKAHAVFAAEGSGSCLRVAEEEPLTALSRPTFTFCVYTREASNGAFRFLSGVLLSP